jgi:hypothetical protein
MAMGMVITMAITITMAMGMVITMAIMVTTATNID